MIVTVKFPVRNAVRIDEVWPIQVGPKTYFLDTKDGRATAVGVQRSGVPVSSAPKIEYKDEGPARVHIISREATHVLSAEYDLRAWQAMLVSIIFIDIDFDSPGIEFRAETDAEREHIHIHDFTIEKSPPLRRGLTEFGIFARAFLALDIGRSLIEPMSLFRDATKAHVAGRSIDAYNGFYLFLESQYCRGRTGTDAATAELLKSSEFVEALESVLAAPQNRRLLDGTRFKQWKTWESDRRPFVREIVELRGQLRHHSLNSPKRWDPNKQEDYNGEATLLSLIAYELAFRKTSGRLWEPSLAEQFRALADEMHMITTVHVRLTIKADERIRDVGLDLTFPQRTANAKLAQAALTKALEEFDERSPGAELLGMRAWIEKGAELFRYDLGPSLPR